jgi:hypothetical protein
MVSFLDQRCAWPGASRRTVTAVLNRNDSTLYLRNRNTTLISDDSCVTLVSVSDSQGKGKSALPFWNGGMANKKTALIPKWYIPERLGTRLVLRRISDPNPRHHFPNPSFTKITIHGRCASACPRSVATLCALSKLNVWDRDYSSL